MNPFGHSVPTKVAGKYQIKAEIGRGGMGVVYRVTHGLLGRDEALKALHPALGSDPQFVARFEREARAMARLDHENILRIYDIFEDGGTHYIAMELFPGGSLSDLLQKRGPLSPLAAVNTILQAARGLAYAHAQGIVHRDVKPSNLMVAANGRAKLADFGVAAAAGETGITTVGQVVGSPRYMAPEQARGEPTDARSDLYSLGVVFYEALTGETPFKGHSSVAIIGKLAYGQDELALTFPSNVPPALVQVVRRMVRRTPQERYCDADALIADLEHLLAQGDLADEMPEADADATVVVSREPTTDSRPRTPTSATPRNLAEVRAQVSASGTDAEIGPGATAEPVSSQARSGVGSIRRRDHAALLSELDEEHTDSGSMPQRRVRIVAPRRMPTVRPAKRRWPIVAAVALAASLGGVLYVLLPSRGTTPQSVTPPSGLVIPPPDTSQDRARALDLQGQTTRAQTAAEVAGGPALATAVYGKAQSAQDEATRALQRGEQQLDVDPASAIAAFGEAQRLYQQALQGFAAAEQSAQTAAVLRQRDAAKLSAAQKEFAELRTLQQQTRLERERTLSSNAQQLTPDEWAAAEKQLQIADSVLSNAQTAIEAGDASGAGALMAKGRAAFAAAGQALRTAADTALQAAKTERLAASITSQVAQADEIWRKLVALQRQVEIAGAAKYAGDTYQHASKQAQTSEALLAKVKSLRASGALGSASAALDQFFDSARRAEKLFEQARAQADVKVRAATVPPPPAAATKIPDMPTTPLAPPTAADMEALERKLAEFRKAFQARDLARLKAICQMSDARTEFLQRVFAQYLQVEISVSSVSVSSDTARAAITIDRLISISGDTVQPAASWRRAELVIPRHPSGTGWQDIVW
jgi:serine/threonine-protein kinase